MAKALLNVSPEAYVPLKYYEYRVAEERQKLIRTISFARTLFEEYDCDKKAVFEKIGRATYCKQAMRALKIEGSAEDVAKAFEEECEKNKKKSMFLDAIEDYEEPGI